MNKDVLRLFDVRNNLYTNETLSMSYSILLLRANIIMIK
jgi:hypothetical protein